MNQFTPLRIGRLVFIAFLASLFTEGVFAQQPDVKDWIFPGYGPVDQLRPKHLLTLRNVTTGKAVKYGEREYGINLIWDSSGKSLQNISLEVIPGSSNSIKDGAPVAIRVDGGGYLKYAQREYGINTRCEREYGINLKWSPTPVYEWEIRGSEGQGQIGTLYTESNIGIYNRTHQQYIVYCKREYGINLSWQKDCKRFAPPEGGPQMPNFASAVLSYSTGLLADVPCYGDLSWRFTPVKLTGSSGKSVSFRINGGCGVLVSTLRPGTWRIQAGGPRVASAECEVKLYPGANSFLMIRNGDCFRR